jgi:uncharacterized protein (TIGR03435 family)
MIVPESRNFVFCFSAGLASRISEGKEQFMFEMVSTSPVKSRIRLRATAFLVQAGALFAQDITGMWQGTIHTAREIREVIKISKEDNVFKAELFSIDAQPVQSVPSPPVILQGKAIKIQFPGIGGTYQGTLSADGNSIAGVFLQDAMTLTLNLVRATAETAWETPATPLPEIPMPVDAKPSFELATIKPSPPDARGGGSGMNPGGRFTAHNLSLRDLILLGYGLHPSQIEGGPAWFETDRFDIVAKADTAGAPNKAQVMMMVQKLLADRFSLRFRREKKELAIYALTVQKSGFRLTPSTGDPNGLSTMRADPHGHLMASNMTMEEFTMGLQGNVLDRPVIDRTRLSQRFDFTLDWTPDEFQASGLGARTQGPDSGATFPNLFTAVKDQLGLKLESTRGAVEIFIIDRVKKPSGN